MKKLSRRCWLCAKPLMAISHSEVTTPDGRHVLWVHKVCEKDTRDYFRKVTAQQSEKTPNLQEQFYNESQPSHR